MFNLMSKSQSPLDGRLPEATIAAATLRTMYMNGEAFDANAAELLRTATGDPLNLSRTLIVALNDRRNRDDSWRISILRMAPELAPIMVTEDEQHATLLGSVSGLLPETYSRDLGERELLAVAAWSAWGRWPEDASTDRLFDMSNGNNDPEQMLWYRIYLGMAGLSSAAIEDEVRLVESGAAWGSSERIEELRRLAAR